ncbi:hypothetical protein [Mycobacterium sp. Root135]|uniref:hypothetical protein n=1 Tax=Mycobacterium sp. Root135 TaxID=1736457 RepID=UPI0012EAE934|nr:hypothetical protein [Mycobacterium sp. Root135]
MSLNVIGPEEHMATDEVRGFREDWLGAGEAVVVTGIPPCPQWTSGTTPLLVELERTW